MISATMRLNKASAADTRVPDGLTLGRTGKTREIRKRGTRTRYLCPSIRSGSAYAVSLRPRGPRIVVPTRESRQALVSF